MSDAVIVLNEEDCIICLNPAAEQIIGRSAAEAVGQPIVQLLDETAWLADYRDVAEVDSEITVGEGTVRRFFDLHISPLHSPSGQVAGRLILLHDITEDKQTEATHRERTAVYHALFEQAHDAIFLTTEDQAIVDVNRRACELTGFTREELLSMRMTDLEPPDMQAQLPSPIYTTPDADRRRVFETTILHRDGTRIPIELTITPIVRGEDTLFLSIVRDVTERVRTEEKLHEGRRALHLVISSMPNLILLVDSDDRMASLFAPSHFPRILRGEIAPGQTLAEIMPREMASAICAALETSRKSPETITFEHTLTLDDDETVYFEVTTSPVTDSQDMLVVVDDITNLKRAEIAEREQRALAEALRDTVAALTSTLNLDEVFERILANVGRVVPHDSASIMLIDERGVSSVARCRGYESPEIEKAILALRFVVAETRALRTMVETKEPLTIPEVREYSGWLDLPETRWVRSYAGMPICLEGEVIGFLDLNSGTPGFFTPSLAEPLRSFADQIAIAVQNARLYEAAQEYAAELEIRNSELDAFSQTVAHDLKAPLNVIVGYATMLGPDYLGIDLPAEARKCLDGITSATYKMSSIVEGLLLLARLRSTEEAITQVAVGPVVAEAIGRFQSEIAERGIAVEVAPDIPPALGYGPWLEEVFANLIGNAIKYIGQDNPTPHIAIRGFRQDGTVRYEVEDNGLGIAPEDQSRLFEMFARFHVDEATGIGLGLSIVHRIVTKLNGEVGVESAPGEGSIFWFSLPAPS